MINGVVLACRHRPRRDVHARQDLGPISWAHIWGLLKPSTERSARVATPNGFSKMVSCGMRLKIVIDMRSTPAVLTCGRAGLLGVRRCPRHRTTSDQSSMRRTQPKCHYAIRLSGRSWGALQRSWPGPHRKARCRASSVWRRHQPTVRRCGVPLRRIRANRQDR